MPAVRPKIHSVQAALASSAKPSTARRFPIHGPERGMRAATPGATATSESGAARPKPIAAKITATCSADPAKAKPIAVPRNGAEQGVASTTASSPSKKLRAIPLASAPTLPSAVGAPISNTPNRFSAKPTRSSVIASAKRGSWNWKPQPT